MINVKGKLAIEAAKGRTRNALQNPVQLKHLLPVGAVLVATGEHSYDYTLERTIGIGRVKLNGKATITPVGPDGALQFDAKASHRLAGSTQLKLLIAFTGGKLRCHLSYSGTVDATGLIGGYLKVNSGKVQAKLDEGFLKFAMRMEDKQRSALARDAAGTKKQADDNHKDD
jgi:carbon monoxide dehydrogenase subunit G